MPNVIKKHFLGELRQRFSKVQKLPKSQSLYEIGNGQARLYLRYSKKHNTNRTFYGLRQQDLQQLDGYPSFLCFLWDDQTKPLLVPYPDYEDVFQSVLPARDGQFKTQIYIQPEATEMYVASAGRFNVEAYFGWDQLSNIIDSSSINDCPELTHSQVQSLLGAIGTIKGFDVWIPRNDRGSLDWTITNRFNCRSKFPMGYNNISAIAQEIDVAWIKRGDNNLQALFEVEHSTPIYSGLLRFNDLHLTSPTSRFRFSVVARETRRSIFVKQLNRPTFQTSGLNEICTFLEYSNVYTWYTRLAKECKDEKK